jgi:hypothetical protein
VGGSADGVEGHEFTFVDVVADEATVATAATPSNATSGRVKKGKRERACLYYFLPVQSKRHIF